jgi:hypothetical protein
MTHPIFSVLTRGAAASALSAAALLFTVPAAHAQPDYDRSGTMTLRTPSAAWS